ncbi:hypothetical protein ANN_00770 [Periplaneta americana]|uniref:Uncharacterized protein n=1 Tax=Periplaneta americana TaxID=6978 RepID=A0ABQ8TUK6_PERAM|nr:hypothetical protein ANN_00770 [Periplaneta americana]
MVGLCESGNEPPGSLKAGNVYQHGITFGRVAPFPVKYWDVQHDDTISSAFRLPRRNAFTYLRNPVAKASYNDWWDHRANHTIPPFWLDDRPPLLRHVDVRPAAGWSVWALHGL